MPPTITLDSLLRSQLVGFRPIPSDYIVSGNVVARIEGDRLADVPTVRFADSNLAAGFARECKRRGRVVNVLVGPVGPIPCPGFVS